MQLSPRYDAEPLIALDGDQTAIAEPLVEQRRRLAETLASLSDDEWQHPSRCDGWTVRDVIVHLDSTNAFWNFSIKSGRKGVPSKLLATFDPVAGPAGLVSGSHALSSSAVFESFVASCSALVETVAALDPEHFDLPAESPVGHVSIATMLHHALWDSWIHERDITLPLGRGRGRATTEADREIVASLRYAASLSPAFAVNALQMSATGVASSRPCSLSITASDPDVAITVEVADRVTVRDGLDPASVVTFTGDAVGLLEALSQRAPMPAAAGEVAEEHAWLLSGLATVFDQN